MKRVYYCADCGINTVEADQKLKRPVCVVCKQERARMHARIYKFTHRKEIAEKKKVSRLKKELIKVRKDQKAIKRMIPEKLWHYVMFDKGGVIKFTKAGREKFKSLIK